MADLETLKQKTVQLLDEGRHAGYLTPEDHSWRLRSLEAAQSLDEIDAVVTDLVTAPAGTPGTGAVALPTASFATVMGSRSVAGTDLGRRSDVTTVMGETRVDLTALAPGAEASVEVTVVMGETILLVREDQALHLRIDPILGDIHTGQARIDPSAPLKFHGTVILGSLKVRTVPGLR